MLYTDFTLVSVEHAFELRRHEVSGLFVDVLPCAPTPRLEDAIAEGVPLAGAINTAKARSELLIMPVLFDVDPSRGLTGYCDFLLSRGPSQMVLTAPGAVVVEAKNENLMSGIGQCLATMVAARCFNTQAQTGVTMILGAVTSGTRWKFLRLAGDDATTDLDEYDLQHDVARILGILASAIR